MPTLSFAKFAGINNTANPERIGHADLVTADNVDIDDTGQATVRVGRVLERAGATHSLWTTDGGSAGFCVQGTELYRVNDDHTLFLIASGLTPNFRMSYVEVGTRVYFSNGVQTGVIEPGTGVNNATGLVGEGVVRSWGLNMPPQQPIVAIIAGQLPAGTYQYALTRVRNDGQESGTGRAESIDLPAGSGITFTVTTPSDSTIVQQNVYLTMQDGETLYRALTIPIGTTSADYTGDAHELAIPLRTQFLSEPPAGHIVSYYRGRIYIAVDSELYVTQPLGYEYCDLRERIGLDTSRIKLVAPVDNGILVGTEREIHYLSGQSPATFERLPRLAAVAVEGTLVYAPGEAIGDGSLKGHQIPIFTTDQGIVYGTPDGNVVNMTRDRFRFSVNATGAGYFRNDDEQVQYKVFLQP